MPRDRSYLPDKRAEINLTDARTLISATIQLARDLDGLNPPTGNNPERAAAKRDLIYLADILDRASAEVRAVYHVVNGKPDPLEES